MTQTAASIFQEICYSNKDKLSYVFVHVHDVYLLAAVAPPFACPHIKANSVEDDANGLYPEPA